MRKELTPLEALKILNGYACNNLEYLEYNDDLYPIIETALKALEIIKKKRVDVDYLITCIEQNIKPLQFYNEYIKEFNGIELTQEEYDILKKALGI